MSKIAVIKTGGKQYLVQEGALLKVEKLLIEGDKVEFDNVLLVADASGESMDIGKPKTKSLVAAKLVKQGRAKKILVVHYKAKVRHHKKYGHRQPFTEVKIGSIN